MAPKRKAGRTVATVPIAKKARGNVEARKAKAKTIKERILYLVSVATELLGAPTIKKLLITEFGLTESKVFGSNVNKALKELSEAERSDFGKIRGSYHGGPTSPAFLAHEAERRVIDDIARHHEEGCVKCCFCEHWCSEDCFLDEDSVARGGKYQCSNCDKIFWTWISDGYVMGHPVEYRYGDGLEDYADLSD
ncbi:hypothetical protein ACHHYP_05270 [Achlya hypogyna]|uniref:Uncharacterized protein n=1 Tax=Achlya hypogyna TaxID=1202772 RepID=A0A1V9YY80_ACHHY|nr:hypothetical protein ACHHYP_05270 [Achlya hypogyna]